jgi:hypothetical protein
MRITPVHLSCTASVMEILEFHRGNISVGIQKGSNQTDMCLQLYTDACKPKDYVGGNRHIFLKEYTVGMLDSAADAYSRMNVLLECWMPQQTHISE